MTNMMRGHDSCSRGCCQSKPGDRESARAISKREAAEQVSQEGSKGEGWLVKLKRTGFETVISQCTTEADAQRLADGLNWADQTDEYYVEQWQAELLRWPSADDARAAADMIRASIAEREANK